MKFLDCKHRGKYDGRGLKEEYRQRQRGTRKTKCGVRIKATERPGGFWELNHLSQKFCSHNHEFNDSSAYSENRRLTDDQKAIVAQSSAANVSAGQIKATLRAADADCQIISRDIYNMTAKVQRDARGGKPPNEALIKELEGLREKGELYFEYTKNPGTNRIEKMFIADMR
jgi:hypothetical protein